MPESKRVGGQAGIHLVMALCITYTGFSIASIGEGVHNVAHVPVMVAQLLQDVYPLVRDGHLQAVVKPYATL